MENTDITVNLVEPEEEIFFARKSHGDCLVVFLMVCDDVPKRTVGWTL